MLSALLFAAVLFAWFGGCLLTATVAGSKGRPGSSWFFVALFCSPLLALIALVAMPTLEAGAGARSTEADALRSFRPSIR